MVEVVTVGPLGGAYLLPPHVTARLATAGVVVEDKRPSHGRFVVRSIASPGGFKAARFEAYCWAYALRWRQQAVIDLGFVFLRHEAGPEPSRWSAVEADEVKHDIAPAYRKVHHGSTDKGIPEDARRSDMPNMNVEQTVGYLQACLDHCEAGTWPGRTGRTDRLVYRSVVARALGLERPSHRLPISVRQVEQLVGVSYQTAQRSLRRLRESGHLAVVSRAVRSEAAASRYMIRWPLESVHWSYHCNLFPTSGDCLPVPEEIAVIYSGHTLNGHPAFHRSALGKSGQVLLEAVLREPQATVASWCRSAGVARRTFYKLPLLGSETSPALVVKTGDGYVPVPDLMDRLAGIASAGVTPPAEFHRRRDRRIALQREMFDDHLTGSKGQFDPVGPATTCAACGLPCDDLEASTGLRWHDHCDMPAWLVKVYGGHYSDRSPYVERRIEIPPARVAARPPVATVDAHGIDWADLPPDAFASGERILEMAA